MPRRTIVKLAVVAILGAAVAVAYLSPAREYLTRDHVRMFVEHLRGLWYGPAAFIAAFAAGCVLGLPASLFVIAAGLIFGWALGGIYSILAGVIGAVASFYIARFVGEGMLDRFGRLGRAVAKQVDHAGFRSLLVLRFVPGIPFAVLNYGAGVAGVRLRDFVGATLIGVTPPMFVFAYCADALFNGSMSEGDALKRLLIVFALMLAITLLPLAVRRVARRTAAVDARSQ